ncbi:ABC transporter substrate-binding protein [Roseateles toxinivorans]|uniref:Peptide/nickel transport system substrate-binding protein n=1 Tax=Roseateles toxinivorans TaxID=270368 RepID=A0A4R6QNF7_9BURK|nr:ABC transporter substrate-binding protein [Roseateles toxinivorans]TDP71525.1 peptide/nickel transport system substrate-binding protein [Roseateles toxinivorans]
MSLFGTRKHSWPIRLLGAALLSLGLAGAGQAKTLRLASGFDPQSMDPHALALLYQSRVLTQVYENLVGRDQQYQLEPGLALSWAPVDSKTWRFKLRPNVKFHDGSSFSADDAVFSIERALAPNSQRAPQMLGIKGARKVDALTIDVLLEAPDAMLPHKFWLVAMMSKAWCEKHNVTRPQDYNGKQETYAVRNANGTGPYQLKSYESDVRLVLTAHPQWWGQRGDVDEAIYTVIGSDATRLAALNSGQVDFVIDPPFQDVQRLQQDRQLKMATTTDIGTQYLAFDQHRDELQVSDIKGRNPFKDIRVRRAVYQAIDIDLIIRQVLRGQATATGSFISKLLDGHVPELEKRLPYDPAAARALLTEAGYPNGFSTNLDCVNATYRAAVCQSVASMLARVGIKINFVASPSSTFFPKLTQATGNFVEFGWSPGSDPWNVFNVLLRSKDGGGSNGAFNAGRYSNARLDAVVDAMRIEPDLTRRRQMVGEALAIVHAELPVIPLYRRSLNWVMRSNISVVQWPNDILELRWVKIS